LSLVILFSASVSYDIKELNIFLYYFLFLDWNDALKKRTL